MVKKLYRRHEEKVKFLIVGSWNTLFGFIAFVVIDHLLGEIIHYVLTLTLSYILAITNAYFCYKFFVFKTKGNYLREYFKFYIVYGAVFIVNIMLLPIFVEIFQVNVLISQAVIVLFTVLISYSGH